MCEAVKNIKRMTTKEKITFKTKKELLQMRKSSQKA